MTAITRATLGALFLSSSALITGCDSSDDGPLTHGSVKIEFRRAANETTNPYAGATHVLITLDYLDCLIDFYDRETTWRQEGPDGFPVFGTAEDGGEGWKDRLCDGSLPTGGAAVDCSVVSIEQELDVSKHLSVLYEVSGDIENRTIHFGPLPTAELAQCEGGGAPIVRVGSNGAVRGQTSSGDLVWETKSFDPDKAGTDQGLAIAIRAGLP
jgi:hypothetical protein